MLAVSHGIPCLSCGYDLRGLTSSRCPECGHPVAGQSISLVDLPHATLSAFTFAVSLILFSFAGALIFVIVLLVSNIDHPRIWLALPVLALSNFIGMTLLARRRWPGDRRSAVQILLPLAAAFPLAGAALLAYAFMTQSDFHAKAGLWLMTSLAGCPALIFARLRFLSGWTADDRTTKAASDLTWGLAVPVTLVSAIAIPYLVARVRLAPQLSTTVSVVFTVATGMMLIFYGWALLVLFNTWVRLFQALRHRTGLVG